MKVFVLTLTALLFTGVACSDPTACTASFNYGIIVRVEDSASGAPTASGARLGLSDGLYSESMAFPPNPGYDAWHLVGAGERPGVYTVYVQKAGYHEWIKMSVRVTADECHVKAVNLTARLQPA